MTRQETEASPLELIQMVWSFMLSQAVHVAAKLEVFDVLHDAPRSAGEAAAVTGTDERALGRLLRYLTSVGLLAEDTGGRFSSTALGDLLRSDHPRSVHGLAVMYGEPLFWDSWGDLYETVRTGRPAVERRHGGTMFDYLATRPAEAAIFNAGMTSATRVDVPVILDAYDFSRFTKVVDVGGGHGALLQAILERYPRAAGVLYDVPSVIAGARGLASARCLLAEGDMFQSVPSGGEAYILKRILHDWNDGQALQILQNCRRAIAPVGSVLVMDAVVQPPNQPDLAKWLDLNMLALLPGRERTEAEFRDLFAQAGFRLQRVVPAGRLSIVEGVTA